MHVFYFLFDKIFFLFSLRLSFRENAMRAGATCVNQNGMQICCNVLTTCCNVSRARCTHKPRRSGAWGADRGAVRGVVSHDACGASLEKGVIERGPLERHIAAAEC